MKYYFCLVPKEDSVGTNIGRTYAYKNRDKWIECTDMATYLSAGYVKGVDHTIYNGKAYAITKTYLDLDEKIGLFVCVESVSGCDN